MATRMMADCRAFLSESNCPLVIIGDEEEVANAAVAHAVDRARARGQRGDARDDQQLP